MHEIDKTWSQPPDTQPREVCSKFADHIPAPCQEPQPFIFFPCPAQTLNEFIIDMEELVNMDLDQVGKVMACMVQVPGLIGKNTSCGKVRS